jgi:hypothetical protein
MPTASDFPESEVKHDQPECQQERLGHDNLN